MLNDAKNLQAVYIVCGYTDLRKGIDSLSNIISQTYGMDPFQPGTDVYKRQEYMSTNMVHIYFILTIKRFGNILINLQSLIDLLIVR